MVKISNVVGLRPVMDSFFPTQPKVESKKIVLMRIVISSRPREKIEPTNPDHEVITMPPQKSHKSTMSDHHYFGGASGAI